MQIRIHSRERFPEATVATLSIDSIFECFVREGAVRSDRLFIPGESALPVGHYNVSIQHSTRFGRPLPLVASTAPQVGVDRRAFRLGAWIHPGHPREECTGAILLGQEQEGRAVKRTRLAFMAFFDKLVAAKKAGEAIDLEIA